DDGALVILLLTILASVMSLAAIVLDLAGLSDAPGGDQKLHVTLAGFTLLLSWMVVHISFALHYAHEFYGAAHPHSGIKFPSRNDQSNFKPDYWDFMYFSANLGAASQTSDVVIESQRIRRIVLCQTILAFLFNTTILALGI